MTQSKQILTGKPDAALQKSALSQDSKAAKMKLIQDLNTSQLRSQFITHLRSLVSVIEEEWL